MITIQLSLGGKQNNRSMQRHLAISICGVWKRIAKAYSKKTRVNRAMGQGCIDDWKLHMIKRVLQNLKKYSLM